MIPIEVVEKLAGRPLRLVDNRIVAGSSNWAEQPITICVINSKQSRSFDPALLKVILEVATASLMNAQRLGTEGDDALTSK